MNHLAFAKGVTDCGTDLWRCGIFVYFILCIRVAEIKKENSGFTCESEHFTGRAAVFY